MKVTEHNSVHIFYSHLLLQAKLKEILSKLQKNPDAQFFLFPVDKRYAPFPDLISKSIYLILCYSSYPEYYEVIENPMDLTTVKKKLNDYTSVKEALDDLRLIWQNCFTFNVEGSEISNTALALGNELETLVEVLS